MIVIRAALGGALLIGALWFGVVRAVVQVIADETWPDLSDDDC